MKNGDRIVITRHIITGGVNFYSGDVGIIVSTVENDDTNGWSFLVHMIEKDVDLLVRKSEIKKDMK